MIEFLDRLDTEIFLFLNSYHNDFFDTAMYWITKQETWYPVYLLIIAAMVWKFGMRSLVILLFIAIGITLSDQITSSLMKPLFERPRPCHDPEIRHLVHVVHGCGGKYGFASGHAANSFCLVTLLFLFFRRFYAYLGWLFLWAALVSYSRIYVGVHYPGDIITGAILGILIGYLLYRLYMNISDRYRLKSPET